MIEGSLRYPRLISVAGGWQNDRLSEFKKAHYALLHTIVSHDAGEEEKTQLYQLLSEEIKKDSAQIYALSLLQDWGTEVTHVRQLDTLLSLIDSTMIQTPAYYSINNYASRWKRSEALATFPLWTWKSREGKEISVADFRGKYLFIQQIPGEMSYEFEAEKELYHCFKSKKLALLTFVSGERIESKKIDSIEWTCVTEQDNLFARLADSLLLPAEPCNLLIDPEGKLVDKGMATDTITAYLKKKLK